MLYYSHTRRKRHETRIFYLLHCSARPIRHWRSIVYSCLIGGVIMDDFAIVRAYMARKYPHTVYSMRAGNKCVWVSFGLVEMFFIIRDGNIVDIQVD